MSIRLEKPWKLLNKEMVARLGAELGVYQIADENGRVVRIGYAGGRSLFGLRGELMDILAAHDGRVLHFRTEVTSQYMSRFEELLMIHQADFGELPVENLAERRRKIGRLSPAGVPRRDL